MKKKIFSIVICLCLAVTMLQVFELSFVGVAATNTPPKCDCGKNDGVVSESHAWGCPWRKVTICSECGYIRNGPKSGDEFYHNGAKKTLSSDYSTAWHGAYCSQRNDLPTTIVIDHVNLCGSYAHSNGTYNDTNNKGGRFQAFTSTQYDNTTWLPKDKFSQETINFIKNGTFAHQIQFARLISSNSGTDTQGNAYSGSYISTATRIYIPKDYTLILDLNGNRLLGNESGATIVNHGNLIIIDSDPSYGRSGHLEDRGYYYYSDEDGKYFQSTRNAQDVVWRQGSIDEYNRYFVKQATWNGYNQANLAKKYGQTASWGGGEYTMAGDVVSVYGGHITSGKAKGNLDPGATYSQLVTTRGLERPEEGWLYYAHYVLSRACPGASSVYTPDGGGIYNTGKVYMDGGSIVGCESGAGNGAAIHNTGATASFTMSGGKIMYNFGSSIVSANNGATLNINAGTIFRNVCIGNGGVYAKGANVTVNVGKTMDAATFNTKATAALTNTSTNTTWANNLINKVDGKAREIIYKGSNGTTADYGILVIDSNISLAGIATDGNGAGIYSQEAKLTINSALISNNWAHYRGGGIDIFTAGNVNLTGNVWIKNNYCEYKGGGISVRNAAANAALLDLTINSDNVQITGNKAGYGGGVWLSNGDLTLNKGLVDNNESTGFYVYTNKYYGGALHGDEKDWTYAQRYNNAISDKLIIDFLGNTNIEYNSSNGTYDITSDQITTETNAGGETSATYYTLSYSGSGVYIEDTSTTDNTDSNFIMNGGTISNNVGPARGSGVCVTGGIMKMTGGVITKNTTRYNTDYGSGGGVYVSNSDYTKTTFTMSGGEISYNISEHQHAGGVMAHGKVVLSGNSVIKNNECRNNGGGMYASTGEFTMSDNVQILNNVSYDEIGGGILLYNAIGSSYSRTANFTMNGGKISGNKTNASNGGGLYVWNANFIMNGGEISNNTANCTNFNQNQSKNWTNGDSIDANKGRGGGVAVENGNVTIKGNSVISNNEAAFAGGAFYILSSSTGEAGSFAPKVTITGTNKSVKIQNNKLTASIKNFVKEENKNNSNLHGNYKYGGGAFAIYGAGSTENILSIEQAEISGNSTPNNNSCNRIPGGAIYVSANGNMGDANPLKILIKDCSIHDNSAYQDQGGSIYAKGNVAITIDGGTHYNNNARNNGGYIYSSAGTVDILNGSKIYNNSIINDYGGAISISTGVVSLYDGEIYDNTVQTKGGGAIVIHKEGAFNMYNGAIYNNSTGNDVANSNGGAIAILGSGEVNIYGGKIGIKPDGTAAGNVAKNNGGAIYVKSGNIYIGKNNCDGKQTSSNHNNLDPTVSACGHPIIENNSAVNGGGLYAEAGSTVFYCGNMSKNIASEKGGGIYVAGGSVTIKNATVTGNKASEEFYGDALYMAGGELTYANDNTFGNTNGTSTGVVVSGGTLNKTDAVKVVSVYFKDRESDMEVKGFEVPLNTYIILPKGENIFPNYSNHTFIGWQYPNVEGFVNEQSDYVQQGIQIKVINNTGTDVSPKMTIYGVWANDVNTITYYDNYKEQNTITGNGYLASYNYNVANTITLQTPTHSGYTFTGWAMQQGSDCKTNCNANWGISAKLSDTFASAKLYKAGQTIPTNGKFGNLHFVATWSATINYYAVYDDGVGLTEGTNGGSVQVQNASTTEETITVTNQTTAANGAVATPAANYTFIGWYYDRNCTQPVTEEVNGATVTPSVNQNGYYDNLSYYAKFALEYKDLTIATSGADDDQTFVFTVKGTSGYAQNVEMQVYVIGGNSYTTIKHIPAGSYEIYENNIESKKPQGVTYHQGNKWTWRYSDTDIEQAVVNGAQDTGETAVDKVTFNYFTADNSTGAGSKNIKNWLNGLSYKFNSLIKGN